MRVTYSFGILDSGHHFFTSLVVLFVLLKFLLTFGQENSTKGRELSLPVLSPFHLDWGQDSTEVGISNTKVWLL